MKRLATGAMTMMLMLSVSSAGAQVPSSSEVEEMRREIRLLRSQVQTLRAAIAEAADLDIQRGNALTRALKSVSSATDAPAPPTRRDEPVDKPRNSPPPVAAAPAAPVAPAPATLPLPHHNPKKAAEAARKVVEAVPATGTVRGKVTVPRGEPVAYVYVENVTAPAVRDQKHVIEQVGKRFSPSWAVVQRGAVISFPNRDNIYHNVFSLSSGNSFDLGLYSAGESKTHTFNEAGEVEIYCNIHPQMAASALVVPNRLFSKVKPDGTFEIGGVPGGKRKIVAWAPGSRLVATWVEVDPGGAAQVELKLEPKASSHKNKAGQQYGSYE